MRRIRRDAHRIQDDERSLAGHDVGEINTGRCLLRSAAGLLDITGPPQREAYTPIREIGDVLRRIDIAYEGPYFSQNLGGGGNIEGIEPVRVASQINHYGIKNVHRRIDYCNSAVFELRRIARVEQQRPTVSWVRAESSAHLIDVITDAGRGPHVGNGIQIARVMYCQPAHDVRVAVDEIGKRGFVELAIHAGFELPLKESFRW